MKMRVEQMRKATALAVLLAMVPAAGWAFGGSTDGRRPKGPPQAAIDACKDKSAGDPVQFENRRGDTVKAICQERSGQLVAVPEGGFRGRGGQWQGSQDN